MFECTIKREKKYSNQWNISWNFQTLYPFNNTSNKEKYNLRNYEVPN